MTEQQSKNDWREEYAYTLGNGPDEPGTVAEQANWLLSPRQGSMHLALRTYGPRQPIIDQVWKPPTVTPRSA